MHTFGSHSLEKELFFHWRSPVWWPWSLELREKAMKRSLPCFSHHLKYSFLVPCYQYLKLLCRFQNDHSAIWWALLEWRDVTKEGFSPHPPGNERVWIVSSSRGQDLHPRPGGSRLWQHALEEAFLLMQALLHLQHRFCELTEHSALFWAPHLKI